MKMAKGILLTAALCASAFSYAQQQVSGREAFMRQQAFAEMQRMSGQVDALQTTVDDLLRRVSQLERGGGEAQSLKNEIEALKATVASLKRELAQQRGEIVNELAGKIAQMQPKTPPTPAQRPQAYGPTSTYEVQKGDTLSLIAKAFNTTVPKIREMNGLKRDDLRIGQKLVVPQVN